MKINPIMAIVSFLISALAGYGFFAANSGEQFVWLLASGAGLSIFLTLGVLLSVGIKSDSRLGVVVKIVAAVFFVAMLVEHLVFAFTAMRVAPYVIVTGILLLLYFIVCYAISKSQ